MMYGREFNPGPITGKMAFDVDVNCLFHAVQKLYSKLLPTKRATLPFLSSGIVLSSPIFCILPQKAKVMSV